LPYDAAGNINMTGGRRGKQEIFEGVECSIFRGKVGAGFLQTVRSI